MDTVARLGIMVIQVRVARIIILPLSKSSVFLIRGLLYDLFFHRLLKIFTIRIA